MSRTGPVALVDCNNFFVSCERLFAPHLEGRPVIVLSNNDGCAVARSNEAKALGISMASPFYKIKSLVEQHDIAVFSSNYVLYGDISARIMHTLAALAPQVDIYSIDEAFLDLSGFNMLKPDAFCRTVRTTVRRHTGIPVSIGIAPTRTLAKVANRIAKKTPSTQGVLDISPPRYQDKALASLAVGDVWGVGSRWARRLEAVNIKTARQLRDTRPSWIKQKFGVILERTVLELRGIPVIGQDEQPTPRHSITASRSFGQPVVEPTHLREAVASHMARACEKLRQKKMLAQAVNVFIETSRFNNKNKQYNNSAAATLPEATDDTITLTTHALYCLETIFKKGFNYKKAGVLLLNLVPADHYQLSLFSDHEKRAKAKALMRTMDRLNHRLGRGSVRLGAEGTKKIWRMRQEKKSPAYTTRWDEIPMVRAN